MSITSNIDKMDILENKENTAVQAHINMLQGIINRMAANSTNCKTWAIAVLSLLLALYVDNKILSSDLWICYVPMGLFFFLDCFYLGLERQFIKKQVKFVNLINHKKDFSKELFFIELNEPKTFIDKIKSVIKNFFYQILQTIRGVFSFSTLPFYGFIIGLIYLLGK